MRIMWVCNIQIPVMKRNTSEEGKSFGGWMTSMAKMLKEMPEIELAICYPQSRQERLEREKYDGIRFYGFYVQKRWLYNEQVYRMLNEAKKSFHPDVIHVFGTEFPHSFCAMKLNPSHTLVDIQGLMGVYADHYFTGLPSALTTPSPSLLSGRRSNPIYNEMSEMKSRSKYEKATLKRAKYVTGRTDWDYACVKNINPNVNYFKCSRVLRESFYNSEWSYNSCRKHSIFISQADYPIKGFHIFLKALAILKRKYKDIEVTVAGTPLNLKKPGAGTYDGYIKKLIENYRLEELLVFKGLHDETQMRDGFLRTNVFVMPSLIENSPNSLGEAMIMGVPCVAANVGGTNTMLEHGAEGFLYQVDAAYMMAYYIEQIFEHPTIAQSFSLCAKKRAAVTHDRERNLRTLLNIYTQIANTQRP